MNEQVSQSIVIVYRDLRSLAIVGLLPVRAAPLFMANGHHLICRSSYDITVDRSIVHDGSHNVDRLVMLLPSYLLMRRDNDRYRVLGDAITMTIITIDRSSVDGIVSSAVSPSPRTTMILRSDKVDDERHRIIDDADR